jgi:hypothetical protein
MNGMRAICYLTEEAAPDHDPNAKENKRAFLD